MKFSFIAISFLVMLSSNSYAFECNTVMGGCPTDPNAGATAAHMRAENLVKTPTPSKAAPSTGSKTTASPSNTGSKKSQGSLIQTINKNVLK